MESALNPLKEKFHKDLLDKGPEMVVSLWLLEKVPCLFNNDYELYITWKMTLAKKLGIDIASILLVGSGCVGISLNPDKNYKLFDSTSDIDVAIVSDYYFSEAWKCLRNLGSRIYTLQQREKQIVEEHVRKYIYWGTITTDWILPLFPFNKIWQQALSEMAKVHPTENREIKIRLYKDFESLRGYHINHFRNIRNSLLE